MTVMQDPSAPGGDDQSTRQRQDWPAWKTAVYAVLLALIAIGFAWFLGALQRAGLG